MNRATTNLQYKSLCFSDNAVAISLIQNELLKEKFMIAKKRSDSLDSILKGNKRVSFWIEKEVA